MWRVRKEEYSRVRNVHGKGSNVFSFGARMTKRRSERGGRDERGRGDVRDVSEMSLGNRGSYKSVSSVLFPTSICAFYGLNFLKDVQTTKLNAQLDVKERPPLVEYI